MSSVSGVMDFLLTSDVSCFQTWHVTATPSTIPSFIHQNPRHIGRPQAAPLPCHHRQNALQCPSVGRQTLFEDEQLAPGVARSLGQHNSWGAHSQVHPHIPHPKISTIRLPGSVLSGQLLGTFFLGGGTLS